jgi:hypothetical protein
MDYGHDITILGAVSEYLKVSGSIIIIIDP